MNDTTINWKLKCPTCCELIAIREDGKFERHLDQKKEVCAGSWVQMTPPPKAELLIPEFPPFRPEPKSRVVHVTPQGNWLHAKCMLCMAEDLRPAVRIDGDFPSAEAEFMAEHKDCNHPNFGNKPAYVFVERPVRVMVCTECQDPIPFFEVDVSVLVVFDGPRFESHCHHNPFDEADPSIRAILGSNECIAQWRAKQPQLSWTRTKAGWTAY